MLGYAMLCYALPGVLVVLVLSKWHGREDCLFVFVSCGMIGVLIVLVYIRFVVVCIVYMYVAGALVLVRVTNIMKSRDLSSGLWMCSVPSQDQDKHDNAH